MSGKALMRNASEENSWNAGKEEVRESGTHSLVIVIEGELLMVVGLLEMRLHWCIVGPASSIVTSTHNADLSLFRL